MTAMTKQDRMMIAITVVLLFANPLFALLPTQLASSVALLTLGAVLAVGCVTDWLRGFGKTRTTYLRIETRATPPPCSATLGAVATGAQDRERGAHRAS